MLPDDPRQPGVEILAISFAYPPLAYPRSIQVARLLSHLDARSLVVCADEPGARIDKTIGSGREPNHIETVRIPFAVPFGKKLVDRLLHRLYPALWKERNLVPDQYLPWKPDVLKAVRSLMQAGEFRPQVMVTFGQPFTDHLIGLELKRRYGFRWIAHFSDPWSDSPFNSQDARTNELNRNLEGQVADAADLLVFTSAETVDLVMKKYSGSTGSKARVLPHCFEERDYELPHRQENSKISIRYIGDFYGDRSPAPLLTAILNILRTDATALDDVCFEFAGLCDPDVVRESDGGELPAGMLRILGSVDYAESLRLISSSDGLLVIDAPAQHSVFLPSKLIEYIGSGKPILGLTPKGTSSSLIVELGGTAVDPTHGDAVAAALLDFVALLRQRRREAVTDEWGRAEVRERYRATVVADAFSSLIRELPN